MQQPRIQSTPPSGNKFPKLWVSTPTLDGRVGTEYMRAYDNLKAALFQQRINTNVDFLSGNSILPGARNYLVNRFMESGADWLLMVDSDISYYPEDILAALPHTSNALIGLPCCKKFAKWDRIAETVRNNPDYPAKDIPAILADANFAVPESGILRTDDYGLANVEWIGTGVMLTSREALDKIVAANPGDLVECDGKPVQQFFRYESLVEEKDGKPWTRYYGEDVSFCRLAKRSGVAVKAKMDARTGHAGFFDYRFDAQAVSRLKYVPAPKKD
jgi:hypothetical protein